MSADLKVVSYFFDDEGGRELAAILSRVEGLSLTSTKVVSEEQLSTLGKEELPDVVFFELDGHAERHIQDLELLLKEHRGSVSVYVTYKEVALDLVRRMMRIGVMDIFPQPLQTQELMSAMAHAVSAKRERIKASQGAKGGVTAFIDAKGGVGSTTLAVNVAHVLAQKHKAEVLLIDFDLQFGDVAISLDLHPRSTVLDALRQPDRVDTVLLSALITKHDSGLDILPSPGNLTSLDELMADPVRKILQAAVQDYEFVILDLPRFFNAGVIEALKFSDPVMLVCQNSLETIRNAKVILDNLSLIGVSLSAVELINNRAMAKSSSVTIDKLKSTLGKERIHRVRNDYAAAVSAQDQGLPVASVDKKSDMAKDVLALAEYILHAHRGDNKKKQGFFARLFK
ncbi:MAG: AAA family ATPase [Gammaproteobacteria bacterium]|nr:AAA family ATPase [Gammaproteobacteria bacterium]